MRGKGAALSPLSAQKLRRALARRYRRFCITALGWILAQGIALEIDAMGAVNDAVEDAFGDGGVADLFVPLGHWQLRSEDEGTRLIAVLADLPEVATFGFGEWVPRRMVIAFR